MQSFNQNTIKHKLGLLNLAAELGNVSNACKMMDFSRDTFITAAALLNDKVFPFFEANKMGIIRILTDRARNIAASWKTTIMNCIWASMI